MRRDTRKLARQGAGLVGSLLLTAAVQGQVQPILGGRALDANPMVGSGGTNNPVAGYVPINGNDIMSGNVSGLAYFHGRVPTASLYEFGGNGNRLSSFDSFLRQSAGSPANGAPYLGQVQPFYLKQNLVGTQTFAPGMISNVTNGSGAITGQVVPRSVNPAYVAPQTMIVQPPGSLPIGAEFPVRDFQQIGNGSIPGFTGSGEISPLFGLRTNAGSKAMAPDDEDVPPEVRTDAGVNAQVDGAAGAKALRARLIDKVPGADPLNQFVGQTNQMEPKQPGADQLRVSDEYQGVLAALQSQPGAQGTAREPVGSMTNTLTIKPKPNPLTSQSRVEKAGSNAGTNAGAAVNGATGSGNSGAGGVSPSPAAGATANPSPQKMPDALPPMPKTVEARSLVANAEAQLKAGKYLDAADNYQRAMAVDPENTAAPVGRADAELAGGLYESAAFDLRVLYERQPALVTTRHDLVAALGPRRVAFLAKDLKELSLKPEGTHASFLLAYVSYQTGKGAEVKQALDAWAKAEPRNTWIDELRKAWVK